MEEERERSLLQMKTAKVIAKQKEKELEKMDLMEFRKCREQMVESRKITNSLKMLELSLNNDPLPRLRAMKQKEGMDRINTVFDELHRNELRVHKERMDRVNALKSEMEEIRNRIQSVKWETVSMEPKTKEIKVKIYGMKQFMNSMHSERQRLTQEIEATENRLVQREELQRELAAETEKVEALRRRLDTLKPGESRRDSADNVSVGHPDQSDDHHSESAAESMVERVIDLTLTQTDDESSASSDAQSHRSRRSNGFPRAEAAKIDDDVRRIRRRDRSLSPFVGAQSKRNQKKRKSPEYQRKSKRRRLSSLAMTGSVSYDSLLLWKMTNRIHSVSLFVF